MTVNIAVVTGSALPGRKAQAVADWVMEQSSGRPHAFYGLVDVAEHRLPPLDDELPAHDSPNTDEQTRKWAATIAPYDGFVFVTPEDSPAGSAALGNALHHLHAEWSNTAAGVVCYGRAGGTRTVDRLRLTLCELQIAATRTRVALTFRGDFEDMSHFAPRPHQAADLSGLLDEVESWAAALSPLRRDTSPADRRQAPGDAAPIPM